MAEMIRGKIRIQTQVCRAASLWPVFRTARGLILGSFGSADGNSVEKPQELGWGREKPGC